MMLTTSSSTGHLAMSHTVTAVLADADQVPDLLGQAAGQDDRQGADGEQDDEDHASRPTRSGSSLPDRPPLLHVVDRVGRPHEGRRRSPRPTTAPRRGRR